MDSTLHYISVSHADSVMASVNKMRLDSDLCDVVVVVGNTRIQAHGIILAASAPFFIQLAKTCTRPIAVSEYTLENMDEAATLKVIEFCYTSAISVDEENLWSIFVAATKLGCKEIADLCCQQLTSSLDIDTCVQTHLMAVPINNSSLLVVTGKFIAEHIEQLCAADTFLCLTSKEILELLTSLHYIQVQQEQTLKLVTAWLEYDLEGRIILITQLVEEFSGFANNLQKYLETDLSSEMFQSVVSNNATGDVLNTDRPSSGRVHNYDDKRFNQMCAAKSCSCQASQQLMLREVPLYICVSCGEAFDGQSQLSQHIQECSESVHAGIGMNGEHVIRSGHQDVHLCDDITQTCDNVIKSCAQFDNNERKYRQVNSSHIFDRIEKGNVNSESKSGTGTCNLGSVVQSSVSENTSLLSEKQLCIHEDTGKELVTSNQHQSNRGSWHTGKCKLTPVSENKSSSELCCNKWQREDTTFISLSGVMDNRCASSADCNDHQVSSKRLTTSADFNDHQVSSKRLTASSADCNDHQVSSKRLTTSVDCNDHQVSSKRLTTSIDCNDHQVSSKRLTTSSADCNDHQVSSKRLTTSSADCNDHQVSSKRLTASSADCNDHQVSSKRLTTSVDCNDHQVSSKRLTTSSADCNDHQVSSKRLTASADCNDHQVSSKRLTTSVDCNDHQVSSKRLTTSSAECNDHQVSSQHLTTSMHSGSTLADTSYNGINTSNSSSITGSSSIGTVGSSGNMVETCSKDGHKLEEETNLTGHRGYLVQQVNRWGKKYTAGNSSVNKAPADISFTKDGFLHVQLQNGCATRGALLECHICKLAFTEKTTLENHQKHGHERTTLVNHQKHDYERTTLENHQKHDYERTTLVNHQKHDYERTTLGNHQKHDYQRTTLENHQKHEHERRTLENHQKHDYERTTLENHQKHEHERTTLENHQKHDYERTTLENHQKHYYERTTLESHQKHVHDYESTTLENHQKHAHDYAENISSENKHSFQESHDGRQEYRKRIMQIKGSTISTGTVMPDLFGRVGKSCQHYGSQYSLPGSRGSTAEENAYMLMQSYLREYRDFTQVCLGQCPYFCQMCAAHNPSNNVCHHTKEVCKHNQNDQLNKFDKTVMKMETDWDDTVMDVAGSPLEHPLGSDTISAIVSSSVSTNHHSALDLSNYCTRNSDSVAAGSDRNSSHSSIPLSTTYCLLHDKPKKLTDDFFNPRHVAPITGSVTSSPMLNADHTVYDAVLGKRETSRSRICYPESGSDMTASSPTNNLWSLSMKRKSSARQSLACNVCNKVFTYQAALLTHMRTHSLSVHTYQCQLCHQSFDQALDFKVHVCPNFVEKPFSCPSCDQTFAKNIHLKRHLATHSGLKPYPCWICGKRFSRSDHLKRHTQSVHAGSKPHVCLSCGKEFVRKYELNKHMVVHSFHVSGNIS